MGWSSQWPQRHYPVSPNLFTWRWGDLVQARRHPHTLHTGGVRYRHIQKQQTCRTEFASYGGEHPTQFPGKWPTNTVAYLCVPQGPDFHAKNMCAYMNPFNCISHYMTYTQTQHTILLWTIYVPQLEFWITLHVDIFFTCNSFKHLSYFHAWACLCPSRNATTRIEGYGMQFLRWYARTCLLVSIRVSTCMMVVSSTQSSWETKVTGHI